MEKESLNVGPKLPYLDIFRLTWKKTKKNKKQKKTNIAFKAISKFSIRKVLCKIKNPSTWDQKCLIWVFWTAVLKNYYCLILNQHSQIRNAKFHAKLKTWNVGPKIPHLGIFRQDLKSIIFIFGIRSLEFVEGRKTHI